MSSTIEVITRGVLRRRGKVLLCKNVAKGYYYLPGGHVEMHESSRTALAREFLEETGCRVRVGRLIAVSEAAFVHKGKTHQEVNLVFHVEQGGTKPIQSIEPDIAFEWLSSSEVAHRDVRPASAKRLLRSRSKVTRFDSDVD
jgi:ADP-ribose pyrophosphatase YjhB (NUDIX family)